MRGIITFALAAAFLAPAPAQAQTLDFEDLPNTCSPSVPNGYQGFNWSNFRSYSTSCLSGGGYGAGAVSGDNAIFNANGTQALILEAAAANPFRLVSAWVTAAHNNGMQLQVTGLLNGVQQYAQSFAVFYAQPALLAFNNALVDEVRFLGVGGSNAGGPGVGQHVAMDDVTFGVPEPGAGLLVLTGILGLVRIRRRRATA